MQSKASLKVSTAFLCPLVWTGRHRMGIPVRAGEVLLKKIILSFALIGLFACLTPTVPAMAAAAKPGSSCSKVGTSMDSNTGKNDIVYCMNVAGKRTWQLGETVLDAVVSDCGYKDSTHLVAWPKKHIRYERSSQKITLVSKWNDGEMPTAVAGCMLSSLRSPKSVLKLIDYEIPSDETWNVAGMCNAKSWCPFTATWTFEPELGLVVIIQGPSKPGNYLTPKPFVAVPLRFWNFFSVSCLTCDY